MLLNKFASQDCYVAITDFILVINFFHRHILKEELW